MEVNITDDTLSISISIYSKSLADAMTQLLESLARPKSCVSSYTWRLNLSSEGLEQELWVPRQQPEIAKCQAEELKLSRKWFLKTKDKMQTSQIVFKSDLMSILVIRDEIAFIRPGALKSQEMGGSPWKKCQQELHMLQVLLSITAQPLALINASCKPILLRHASWQFCLYCKKSPSINSFYYLYDHGIGNSTNPHLLRGYVFWLQWLFSKIKKSKSLINNSMVSSQNKSNKY